MKSTANVHQYSKFSMTGSRAKVSKSTFELSCLNSGLNLPKNFDDFKEILVQVNKAVYGKAHKKKIHTSSRREIKSDVNGRWMHGCKFTSPYFGLPLGKSWKVCAQICHGNPPLNCSENKTW